ncbi:3-oxoacyl-[acyl-carrier-protein] synthase 3 [Streptomyces poonensis]|uniref:Beta-ketoacyl-[acyl-carrier-protein] synthase III n=2 Tax=Streptomyces poonensis TaxID=68255 RepID=A0A918Q0V7_9ACTN|nr:3-oxoacyl-[acyl-carrier-protein] synthase 3 [Streptomyces poonensis]GLJ93879.1 3-oxoacyl-[acyl-carrier-protein] synthase 3 [Streptomyces poonensis]
MRSPATGGGAPSRTGLPAVPRSAVVMGVGGWLPPDVVTNDDLAARLDTSDAWIRTRTGIARRHVAGRGTAVSDLAVEAGRRALASAGGPAVDAVVLATMTPDHPVPATAPVVAARLGLDGVPAFDLAATCAGFVYGLASAAGLIAASVAERVLVIGAEVLTGIVDPRDRSLAVLFADGAGAVVLRAGHDEPGALGPVVLGSDGARDDLLYIPGGGSRARAGGLPAGTGGEFLRMRGREIFRNAVERMAESSRRALEAAGWKTGDVDRLVAHQANARILAALGDELEIPADRRPSTIEHTGNTASASIPLLLAETVADGRLRPGHRVLITAFGGGLAWGATTLVWPELPAGH